MSDSENSEDPEESTTENPVDFTTRWKTLKDDETIKSLGRNQGFKTLRVDCAAHGLKPCGSRICSHPIQPFSGFSKDKSTTDGFKSVCKRCADDPAVAQASKKQKLAFRQALDTAPQPTSTSNTEDVARDTLVIPGLAEEGIECSATLEFRTADLAARYAGSDVDAWMCIQLKTDGVYKSDGVTPKPNDRSHPNDGGGRATFHHCTGYEGMLIIFVKSRLNTETGQFEYTTWICRGAELSKEKHTEHTDGTLGENCIKPCSGIPELASILKEHLNAAMVASSSSSSSSSSPPSPPLKLRTLTDINLDVTQGTHRKEIVLMMALKAVGKTIEFKPGNSTSVDCLVDGVPTQVKTYNLTSGKASAKHHVKGKENQPYDALDGIEQLLEGLIVKSGDKFYLLYAVQPLDALLYNDIFSHAEPYRGHPPSPGNTTISPPLGIFQLWLKGKRFGQAINERVKWLSKPAFNWRIPVELTPGDHGIPAEWIEEAAQEAASPANFPSSAKLKQLEERIQQSEMAIIMAAAGRAEQAAARAEDAVEAAAEAAAEAGPSQIVNNNITNNNIHNNLHLHLPESGLLPPTKRLKQVYLSSFFSK